MERNIKKSVALKNCGETCPQRKRNVLFVMGLVFKLVNQIKETATR